VDTPHKGGKDDDDDDDDDNNNNIKMADQRLTGVSRSELHTQFEQRPMLLGHIILNAFMANCTDGFREEPCNWQSAFPCNLKENHICKKGKICLKMWARILDLKTAG
jgi:hypothetical protein